MLHADVSVIQAERKKSRKMKLLAFVAILALGAQAVVLDPRQTCVNPTSNIASLPSECQTGVTQLSNVLNNITQPIFIGVDAKLDAFCLPQCVQPYVDYYTCLGETDYANVFDGFLCGKYNNQYCFQLWKNVFILNGSNPTGVCFSTIIQNCNNPLNCNSTCSTELNKAKTALDCCLAGIVEFNTCGALSKVRYDECSIPIPPICEGVASTPSTPAPPEYPTASTNCVHPLDDPDYPTNCKNNLTVVDNVLISMSSDGFTSNIVSTNITAVLTSFCTPECVRPLVTYYNCTGEPSYANAINGFLCMWSIQQRILPCNHSQDISDARWDKRICFCYHDHHPVQ